MDRAGVELCVLSLAGSGAQVEHDPYIACRKAHEVNDLLAAEIRKQPTRYGGFAHLPMQDPVAAAAELERCVRDLGFCGAMINGHTNGLYPDDPMFYRFWERVEEIGAPIYLHPADPISTFPAIAGAMA